MRQRTGWFGNVFLAGAVLAWIGFLSASASADEKTVALYKQKCAACHGADGKGETATGKALKVKDFASEEVQKMSNEDLSEVISKGKGKMPAYKALTPEQVKDLAAYVRTFVKKS